MSRKELYALFLLLGLSIDPSTGDGQAIYPPEKPVLQVDTPYPTSDKPQSKLWYSGNSWWALLPRAAGPSLWQRTAGGWVEHPDVGASLKGVPGRADVWPDEDGVTAVGVDPHSLTVYRLEKKGSGPGIRWKAKALAVLPPPFKDDPIETATIARDKRGRWWVAADAGGKVCVWNASPGGRRWSEPYILAEGIDKDDICSFAVLPEGVAVVWSDQAGEAVKMRIHRDSSPEGHWEEAVTIDSGNNTADDHIRTSLSPDGTLWVATKNSLDEPGEPQLVLRVKPPEGRWRNFAYAFREAALEPSRPVVLATENPDIVLAGHTVYNRRNPYWGEIVFGRIDTLQTGILAGAKAVIVADTTGWIGVNRINDITGPRKPFPMDVPWIVLASDKDGRVYEADLRRWFYP